MGKKKPVQPEQNPGPGPTGPAATDIDVEQSPNRPLKLLWMPRKLLSPNPANWRRHPEFQLQLLQEVIYGDDERQGVGWAGGCLYNLRTGRLLDGHARLKLPGDPDEKIPVIAGSWTEDQEKMILAFLDPIANMAGTDTRKLETLLLDLQGQGENIDKLIKRLAREHAIHIDTPLPLLAPDDKRVVTLFFTPQQKAEFDQLLAAAKIKTGTDSTEQALAQLVIEAGSKIEWHSEE